MKIEGRQNKTEAIAIFPCFGVETMTLLVELLKDETKEVIIDKCKKFLLKNSSLDVVLLSKVNSFNKLEMEIIVNQWNELHSISFADYLAKLTNSQRYRDKNKRVKTICTTLDSKGLENFKLKFSEVIHFEKCCNFRSEEELRQSYSKFIHDNSKSLYLFDLDYLKESKHIRFIISVLESMDLSVNFEQKSITKNIFQKQSFKNSF